MTPKRSPFSDSVYHSTPLKGKTTALRLRSRRISAEDPGNDKSRTCINDCESFCDSSSDYLWLGDLNSSLCQEDGRSDTPNLKVNKQSVQIHEDRKALKGKLCEHDNRDICASCKFCDYRENSSVILSNDKTNMNHETSPKNNDFPENIFITQSLPADILNSSTKGLATQLKEGLHRNAKNIFSFKNETPNAAPFVNAKDDNQEQFYELSVSVKALFKKHHRISELYDWQRECLSLKAVRERRNLVYSLPTSGGKTLVAEVLVLQELLHRCKNAIFVFPFVCIVQEKVRSLSPLALELGFAVEEYAGGKGQFPPRKRRNKKSVFIATIEKAHMLVNSLIELERINEIGLVVVDELHMIFEGGDRGADLEILLTKLKLFSECIHIVGMSATINNIQDVAKFLNADVYKRNFRPVELKEYIKVESRMMSIDYHGANEFNIVDSRTVNYKYPRQLAIQDPDHILGLVLEVLPKHSCLIFCPTKKQCQNLAIMLCKNFPSFLLEVRKEERRALLNALVAEVGANGLCPMLSKTIPYGVAYHHSGLTMDERKLIEEAYSYGTLYLLTCTSTLAAGVNLPAKRVIVRAPYVGTSFMSSAQYKQMVGRAGRAGLDSSGESIIIIKPSEMHRVNDLLSVPEDKSCSTLFSSGRNGLFNFVLGIVGLKLSNNAEELKTFVWQTLYGIQNPLDDVSKTVEDTVTQLIHLGLIAKSNKNQNLKVTSLGTAVVKSGVDIFFCQKLQEHMRKALQSLSLVDHLHLLFLVTPYDLQETLPVDPQVYYSMYMSLSSGDQKTASLIGIPEAYVTLLAAGRSLGKKANHEAINRFYLTLALYELWQQKPLADVAHKFHTHKGTIHNLMARTASFASSVLRFSQELNEFWALADLLPNFVKQLQFCCRKELLPLMEIPAVKQGRARQLYQAGYKSVMDVAKADAAEMSRNIEHMPKRVASQVISAAKMILQEQAEALQDEADELMEGLQSTDLQPRTKD